MRRRLLQSVAALAVACGGSGSAGPATEGSTSSAGDTLTTGMPADSGGQESTGEPEPPGPLWPLLNCDPLVESLCALPFPNNVFTIADPDSPTGRRLELSVDALPQSASGVKADPAGFGFSDGFSPSMPILAHLPGAVADGLPSPASIAASLEDESPTVLLELPEGRRVAHFAEVDATASDDARRALILRGAAPLRPATRYIVAIREVIDGTGALVPASTAFAALRDDTPTDDPAIEDRRKLYEDIFGQLDSAGVAREELQLAWDFTTASLENDTDWLVAMRDRAIEATGDDGPDYTITEAVEEWAPGIAMHIEGEITVPLFLDSPDPGGALVLDDEGLPEIQGTAAYPFVVLVPKSAADTPAGIIHIGHGLLGAHTSVHAAHYQEFAIAHNYILIATDWIGMSEDDVGNIVGSITSGELHKFKTVVDRLQQGVINAVLAIRMLKGGLADDPVMAGGGSSYVDPSRVYYIGSSQGGILGATLMAVSPDIQRGVLDVPGQPYSLLLNRSVDFEPFIALLNGAYSDPLDIQLLLGLSQILWDRAEPAGYSRTLRDPLPGSPAKDVLIQVAIGDHQVTTLGAHVMARAVGATNLAPTNRDIYGVESKIGPLEGVAMIEYDFGLPPEPLENVPMTAGNDPHGRVRALTASVATRAQFLATGVIESFCDGPCDPE